MYCLTGSLFPYIKKGFRLRRTNYIYSSSSSYSLVIHRNSLHGCNEIGYSDERWYFWELILYHAPQKDYLPEKILPELFLGLPLPDLSFFELILENFPIPIVFMWGARHFPPRTPALVELFFITVTRFDWTTGVPDNGHEWRKFRAVPRLYPLRPLVLYFV